YEDWKFQGYRAGDIEAVAILENRGVYELCMLDRLYDYLENELEQHPSLERLKIESI
ncbi:hypothetical protein BG000_005088, partial [Podila horticola]